MRRASTSDVSAPSSLFQTQLRSKGPTKAEVADFAPLGFGPFDTGPVWKQFIGPLLQKYGDAQSYEVDQNVYLSGRSGPEKGGVCRAMSIDWVGRYQAGLKSFGQTPTGSAPTGSWNGHMAKKFIAYTDAQQRSVDSNLADANLKSEADAVVVSGKALQQGESPEDVRLVSRKGEDVIGELFAGIEPEPGDTYLLGLAKSQSGEFSGHAVALAIEDDHVRFMDPNLGEFKFMANDEASAERFQSFMSDWYNKFAPHFGDQVLMARKLEPR